MVSGLGFGSLLFGGATSFFFNPTFISLIDLSSGSAAIPTNQYKQGCYLMSGSIALFSALGCWLFSMPTEDERINEFELSNQQ